MSRHRHRVARWLGAGLAVAIASTGLAAAPSQAAPSDVPTDGPIPSLKETYKDYFKVGNIYSGRQTYEEGTPNWAQVEKHYNIMTGENLMKPDQLLPNDNINLETGEWNFTFGEADYFVDESLKRGIDVHGHVLVWHSQSPAKLTEGNRAEARANMERYIKEVLTHFKGRAVSWDVVNEAFVDGVDKFDPATQNWEDFLRGNPDDYSFSGWYNAYTTDMDVEAGERPGDFIYDAFVFARKYDPDTKLEYNDFNVFQSEGKAKAIIAMATELNQRYAEEYPDDPRQLIETIGLQSHNYINQTPAFACADSHLPELVDKSAEEWQPGACSDHASVERSLQLIVDAGFTPNVSELDLQVWEAWNAEPEGTDFSKYADLDDPSVADRFHKEGFTYWVGKIENRMELEAIQAQRYAEYFAVYKKYAPHIDRVTFWGLTDYLNWRATHNPQLFNKDFSEKLAAYAVAYADAWLAGEQPSPDPTPDPTEPVDPDPTVPADPDPTDPVTPKPKPGKPAKPGKPGLPKTGV